MSYSLSQINELFKRPNIVLDTVHSLFSFLACGWIHLRLYNTIMKSYIFGQRQSYKTY